MVVAVVVVAVVDDGGDAHPAHQSTVWYLWRTAALYHRKHIWLCKNSALKRRHSGGVHAFLEGHFGIPSKIARTYRR